MIEHSKETRIMIFEKIINNIRNFNPVVHNEPAKKRFTYGTKIEYDTAGKKIEWVYINNVLRGYYYDGEPNMTIKNIIAGKIKI